MLQEEIIVFPFGAATVEKPAAAATVAVSVSNTLHIVEVAGNMTADMTLNATPHPKLLVGSRLIVTAASDGTARSVTFGSGFTAAPLTGTASKRQAIEFIYTGVTFIPLGRYALS